MNNILSCTGYELLKDDIVTGKDCYLYDVHDKRYIDFEAGLWCTALGHSHSKINQVIHTQIEQISHFGYRYTNHLIESAAAEILNTLSFPDGKCIFLTSGSEAVEFAIQTAMHLTEKPYLLTFSDSYLGAYGFAGKKNPDEWFCFNWSECVNCSYTGEGNQQCKHLSEIPFERIGGFVFEPGNSHGLVRFPPKQLVQSIVHTVKQQHGKIILNEVTTGLGRTGKWYGFQHYDLQPDIIALGKGLGNGFPVSAVVMSGDISENLENNTFRYVQSHQNDPLGCAVAREVVTVIREDELVRRSEKAGKFFLQELQNLADCHSVIKEVRGRGLMIVMELINNYDKSPATRIFCELLKKGILVGCKPEKNILRFYPPLTIQKEDIVLLVESLDQLLKICL